MTARPSPFCTYPACYCINAGGECQIAKREIERDARDDLLAQERICSICRLPESLLDQCESEDCIKYDAEMVAP